MIFKGELFDMKGELFDMAFFGLNMVYRSKIEIQVTVISFEESEE